jgi:hypothetical protein
MHATKSLQWYRLNQLCPFIIRDIYHRVTMDTIIAPSHVTLPAVISVSINPGAIALTRIFEGPSSFANAFVKPK